MICRLNAMSTYCFARTIVSLFIYGLCNDANSNANYAPSNDRIVMTDVTVK
jgi:hypothetical protein